MRFDARQSFSGSNATKPRSTPLKPHIYIKNSGLIIQIIRHTLIQGEGTECVESQFFGEISEVADSVGFHNYCQKTKLVSVHVRSYWQIPTER
jgi:hypothetical protein